MQDNLIELTEQQKMRKSRDEIIRDYFKKGMSMAAIGRKYKLTRERIRQIVKTVDNS